MPRSKSHREALSSKAAAALQRVGRSLRQARLRRNITIEDLAKRCDVGPQTISRIEKGDPGVAIGTLATALHVMGMVEALAELAERDPDGEAMERVRGRQRARRRQLNDLDF